MLVDTSALLALLDADDQYHARAAALLAQHAGVTPLQTHNYVVVETLALVQRRLGLAAVRTLQIEMLPLLHVCWIDEQRHATTVAAFLSVGRRGLTFVDLVSFALMRSLGIRQAFAFDRDFVDAGFDVVPG